MEVYNVTIQILKARKSQRGIESTARKLNGSDESVAEASFEKLLKEHMQNHKLVKIVNEHHFIFHSKRLPGLPASSDADHKNEIKNERKSPFRSLQQLSHAQLEAANEYNTENLKFEKIRLSMSPYTSPFVLAKKGRNPSGSSALS